MANRVSKLMVTGPLLVAALTISPAWARHPSTHRPCDPQTGDAVQPAIQALNRLKNRETAPTARDINPSASLAAMARPGPDETRWTERKAATVVGYVADVKMGGIETVNCHARSAHGRDTHIDLTATPSDAYDERRHVIVEVTPRWRAAVARSGVDWETDSLRQRLLGRCVRITGWLLFDREHRGQSDNTASSSESVWRATAWEIHPVTKIEVLASCPR